jgi:hypothetical protein
MVQMSRKLENSLFFSLFPQLKHEADPALADRLKRFEGWKRRPGPSAVDALTCGGSI